MIVGMKVICWSSLSWKTAINGRLHCFGNGINILLCLRPNKCKRKLISNSLYAGFLHERKINCLKTVDKHVERSPGSMVITVQGSRMQFVALGKLTALWIRCWAELLWLRSIWTSWYKQMNIIFIYLFNEKYWIWHCVWESLYKWEHESSILFYITQIMYMLVLKQQNLWCRKKKS